MMPPPPGNWFIRLLRQILCDRTLVRLPIRGLLFLVSLFRHQLDSFSTRMRTQATPPPPLLPLFPLEASITTRLPIATGICASMSYNRFAPGDISLASCETSRQLQSSQDIITISGEETEANNSSTNSDNVPSPLNSGQSSATPLANDCARPFGVAGNEDTQANPKRKEDDLTLAASVLKDTLFPIAPSLFERYTRNMHLPSPKKKENFDIQPLTTTFRIADPQGWTSIRHPEGALYFFHKSADMRILTDANIRADEVRNKVDEIIFWIFEYLSKNDLMIASDTDLVLDLVHAEQEPTRCGYYFVNHKTRSVFWLDKFPAEKISGNLLQITSLTHIGHEIEAQYWHVVEFTHSQSETDSTAIRWSNVEDHRTHWELFPDVCEVTQEIINELRDIVVHNQGDVLTSPVSTAPYGLGDLKEILSLVNSLEKSVGTQLGGSSCIVGRFMALFVHQRFLNYHGEPVARLSRDQSIFGDSQAYRRSFLITILSPLFFCAPDVHLRILENMYVDSIISTMSWNTVIEKLTKEWQEYTLYSQVLLNANVAFLAIQSVDSDSNTDRRSFTQIASYLSTMYSIGSIIVGLLLVRQHRMKEKGSAEEAAKFLDKRCHPNFGLEILALIHSLPYAMLMWATVFFLVAFSFLCLRATDMLTQLIVGMTWAAIAVLVSWCIWVTWETPEWAWYRRAWKLLALQRRLAREKQETAATSV